jgi:hypothetical protein
VREAEARDTFFCSLSSDLCPPFGRPGGDLLSHVLGRSTIGAEGFHGRVRDGIGCMAPRHDHQVVGTEDREQRTEIRGQKLTSVLSSDLWRMSAVFVVEARFAGAIGSLITACDGRFWIKPNERLVPVSFTHCCASTPGLSTWWSSTALQGELVLRGVSRLDAFSGYPDRT